MRSQKYKQTKYGNNEAEYEESSVIDEVPSYFNIFKCGKNVLNRLGVTYEQACMATPKDKNYTKLLETVIEYNDHHNEPLSNEKIRQAIRTVTEERERKNLTPNVTPIM